MVFIVMEIQSNDKVAATLINSYTDRNVAESKFHQILTSAAVSTVLVHSAVLMTDNGRVLKNETYRHDPKTEDE